MANITSVSCSFAGQALTVSVAWDSVESGALTIYDASGSPVAGTIADSGPGFADWQPGPAAMNLGQPYWAQVVIAQVPSLKIPLLWSAATNVVSTYDDQCVVLTWTAPTGLPTPGSYIVTVDDGTVFQSITTPDTKIALTPSMSLPIGDPWSVTITPTLGASVGPVAAGSVLSASIPVASVACTATSATTGRISVMPGPTSYASFLVKLTQNGTAVLAQKLTYTPGTPMDLSIPAGSWPLSPAGGYEIAIQPVAGNATGPRGSSLPVIVTAPVITLAGVLGGNSPTVAIDVALPPGRPQASGFKATVQNGTTVVGSGSFNGCSGSVVLSSSLGIGTYDLLVSAIDGPNSSGPVAQTNLLTATPTITAIDNDSGIIDVKFLPAVGIATSQIDIIAGEVVVQNARTQSSGIRLAAPTPSMGFGVSVRGVAPGLLGPVCGPVSMICEAPNVQGAVYDLAGKAAVSWLTPAMPPNVDGYTIHVFDGAKLIGTATAPGGTTNSAPLPDVAQAIGGTITVSVRATSVDTGTNAVLSGPSSQAISVLTNAPTSLGATYDGEKAHLWWSPSIGRMVDGYLVTLTDSAGGIASVTKCVSGTELSLAYVTNPNSVVTVAVQAMADNAIGPAATAPLFSPALFPSTNNQNAAYVAPSASLMFGKQALEIYLPALLNNPGSSLPANASFALASTQVAPWTYLLTISPSDTVWGFDASAIRPGLLADITDFLARMTVQGLTAQGDLLLRQVFARILPMTFIETLFYAYNFNAADGGSVPGQGMVDLSPGMALRVEIQSFESLPTSFSGGNAGMVGNTVFDYDIGSYRAAGAWRQGFDAFLSRLVGHGVVFGGPVGGASNPIQTGAGGAPDCYYPNFLQPYYRLIYPPNYLPSHDASVSQNLRENVTLIAAATRADLDMATNTLRNPSSNFQPLNAVYFRGRSLITPRIHVLFNGSDITVPLGTTVANLLERHAALNAAGGRSSQVRMHRGLDGVAIKGWPTALWIPLRLDWTGGCTWGDGSSWLDLPLLHGDRIAVDPR